jgi:glyoxylase-like metal-dependent hydrolase (beta-lactamase superfamily II)
MGFSMRARTGAPVVTVVTVVTVVRIVTVVTALALGGCAFAPPGPEAAAALIRQSEAAMGSAQLKTLVVTGRGSGASLGQAWQPDGAWPALRYNALSRAMNFETGAFREEFNRSRSEPNGGGIVPPMGQGDARGVVLAQDGYAWDLRGIETPPAPVAWRARMHDLWTGTPQGAIKAAARQAAKAGTRRDGLRSYPTLSFTTAGQFSATLVLDDAGLVTRIESTLPNAVLGDMAVVTEFSDYRERAGLQFPGRIRQSQGGFPVLDLTVTEVQVNVAMEVTVPDSVRLAPETVAVEKVAEGVWFFSGGTHNSVAIEIASQIVLVESPLYDGRAAAVFEAANQLVPGKKVQTVINTHHHFDHAGGVRAAVAEGATVITSEQARPFLERALANPNELAHDRMALAGRKPVIIGAGPKTVLKDALRTIEIHELQGSIHAQGLLVVWLPQEKLLIEADAFTPAPPGAPGSPDAAPPALPNPHHLNLVANMDRLGLAAERILPLHGRVVPVAALYAQVGR